MKKFTFHVISLPHTQTTKQYNMCAYTEKIRKFCIMMKNLGHTVYLYASEDNEAPCDELITCITKKEQQELIGDNDYTKEFFKIEWDYNLAYWKLMNLRAATEILKRKKEKDFLCVIGGLCQKDIADQHPDLQCVEFGIGYEGVFTPYRVFESYSHMHYIYGKRNEGDGKNYDCVIPNYFQVEDFQLQEQKEDYYLYFGRLVGRKGINVAIEATKKLGVKLKIVGQGVKSWDPITHTITTENEGTYQGDHIEYLGTANTEQRSELMGKAIATFVCTTYIEPFGGVSIESMLCGTPVITTDYGAFSENNIHGLTGYRARTLSETVEAAELCKELDPIKIRDYAIKNFSLERCAELYQAYFEQIYELWDKGWYSDKLPYNFKTRYTRNF